MCDGKSPQAEMWPARRVVTDLLLKSTFDVMSSHRMQPSDQTSIFCEYGRPSTTSGARYERDCT